jgi:hypothetical protein
MKLKPVTIGEVKQSLEEAGIHLTPGDAHSRFGSYVRASRRTILSRMKPKRKPRTAAVLTMFNAPGMSKRTRQGIMAWLWKQAFSLGSGHKDMAKRCVARYRIV